MIDLAAYKDTFFSLTVGMVRIGTIFNIIPLMGDQVLPGITRNLVTFVFSLLIFPIVIDTTPPDIAFSTTVIVVLKEVFLGLLIGFLGGIPFWIASAVGFFVDTQRGSSMAEMFDPSLGGEASVLGIAFTKVVASLFFVTGAFLAFLALVYLSFVIWPIFNYTPIINIKMPLYYLKALDYMMCEAVLIASPFMILLFLMDFGLGLANRFAPQLNVFSLGFPIKSAVALFILLFYFGNMAFLFSRQFLYSNHLIQHLTRIFSS